MPIFATKHLFSPYFQDLQWLCYVIHVWVLKRFSELEKTFSLDFAKCARLRKVLHCFDMLTRCCVCIRCVCSIFSIWNLRKICSQRVARFCAIQILNFVRANRRSLGEGVVAGLSRGSPHVTLSAEGLPRVFTCSWRPSSSHRSSTRSRSRC